MHKKLIAMITLGASLWFSTVASAETIDDYKDVIEEIKEGVRQKEAGQNVDLTNFDYFPVELYASTTTTDLYYSLYDFNDDGVDDLVVARYVDKGIKPFEDWEYNIYGYYTIDDGEIVNLIPGYGYNMKLIPLTNGNFVDYGKNGLQTGYQLLKQKKDGSGFDRKGSTYTSQPVNGNGKMTYEDLDGNSYSESEFNKRVASFGSAMNSDDLDWEEIEASQTTLSSTDIQAKLESFISDFRYATNGSLMSDHSSWREELRDYFVSEAVYNDYYSEIVAAKGEGIFGYDHYNSVYSNVSQSGDVIQFTLTYDATQKKTNGERNELYGIQRTYTCQLQSDGSLKMLSVSIFD